MKWLHCANQAGKICVWGLVDVDADHVESFIILLATGEMMPELMLGQFIGTTWTGDYPYEFVWHLFERSKGEVWA